VHRWDWLGAIPDHGVALAFDAAQPTITLEPRPATGSECILLNRAECPQAGRLRVVAADMIANPAGIAASFSGLLDHPR